MKVKGSEGTRWDLGFVVLLACLHGAYGFFGELLNCHILKLDFLLEVCHSCPGCLLSLWGSDFHTTYRRWNQQERF